MLVISILMRTFIDAWLTYNVEVKSNLTCTQTFVRDQGVVQTGVNEIILRFTTKSLGLTLFYVFILY